jgi:hypothetical protein
VPLSDGDIRILSLIVAPAVSDLGDSGWNQRFRLDLSPEALKEDVMASYDD